MRVGEVLVSIDHDHGTAAVVRYEDEPGLWLVGSLDHPAGGRLEDFQAMIEGLSDDQTVQGGRTPPGAARAFVVAPTGDRVPAAVGRGAYVAVFPGSARSPQPVRFSGPDGALVRTPHPPDWPREPLAGATETCPVCGAVTWDVVTPLDDSRAAEIDEHGRQRPLPVIVCRTCGHEEAVGAVLYAIAPDDGEDPALVESRVAVDRERLDEERTAHLRAVDFPIYAVRGEPAKLSGWGFGSRGYLSFTVEHGGHGDEHRIAVESERDADPWESDAQQARDALGRAGELGESPDLPPAALSLWFAARERERNQIAARAELSHREIAVDGRPVDFVVAAAAGRWAARAQLDERHSVTVVAIGASIDAVALVGVADPLTLPLAAPLS